MPQRREGMHNHALAADRKKPRPLKSGVSCDPRLHNRMCKIGIINYLLHLACPRQYLRMACVLRVAQWV